MSEFERHLRERASQNYASTTRWAPDSDLTGLVGERSLSEEFDYPMDLRDKPAGDGGADVEFLLRLPDGERWIKVDAKASSYGDWLRVGVGPKHIRPDTIYVLVARNGERGKCVGWEWGHVLMKIPQRRWSSGNLVHAKHVRDLRKIDELKSMKLNWRHYNKGLE